MNEMTYKEGEKDLMKTGLFTSEEYKMAYETLNLRYYTYMNICMC